MCGVGKVAGWHNINCLGNFDIHFEVPAVRYRELVDRFKGTKIYCNLHMSARHLRKLCELDAAGNRMLELVTDRLGLSARSFTRILKVARTIADLEGDEWVREQHLAEAIQYRSLDRKTG